MSRCRSVACTLLASAALIFAQPCRGERLFDVTGSVFHDSNLSQAQYAPDIKPDGAVALFVEYGEFLAPTGSESVALTLFADGAAYRRYSGLDNVAFGARARIRHKFGVGYDEPWIALTAATSYDDFRDSVRDSGRLVVTAELGKRVSPEADAGMGIVFDRRYDNRGEVIVPGIPGNVFDLRGIGGFVRAGSAVGENGYVGARFAVRRGDVVSTAQRSLPIFLASTAITEDNVFGGDEMYAYRLRGTTWTGAVNASLAISERSSVNVGYTGEKTFAAYGNQYRSSVFSLLFAYSQ